MGRRGWAAALAVAVWAVGCTGDTPSRSDPGGVGEPGSDPAGASSPATSGADGGSTLSARPAPVVLHASAQPASAGGWKLLTLQGANGPPTVYDASLDEGGNLWVAAGTDGLYLLRAGSSTFQHFGLADGLHPYGFPTRGSVTQPFLKAISVAGGAPGHAYVGYEGVQGCEDEWDQHPSSPDPNIYKSGDADHVWLSGSGIAVAHYDIFTGPGVVTSEPRGREKLCSIYRIVYDGTHGNVWVGANHGYAWLNPGYTGTPAYAGDDSPQVLQEHAHPAISGYLTDDAPPANDFLLSGGYYGLALQPNGDVWVGGIYRTYRCAGGDHGSNFWGCESDDNALFGHQVDIWPDPQPADAYPRNRVDDYVSGLAVMPDGTVWASARDRQDDPRVAQKLGVGLAHLDASGDVLGYLTDALLSPHLTALAAAPADGTLWVGSEQGLMRYDPQASIVYQFGADALGGEASDAVSNIQVAHDGKGTVVVAFQSGAVGLYTGN